MNARDLEDEPMMIVDHYLVSAKTWLIPNLLPLQASSIGFLACVMLRKSIEIK